MHGLDLLPVDDKFPDFVLGKNEYGVYCVPASSKHRPASRTILNEYVWEPPTVSLLRAVDATGDIVHAGAFFGDFIPPLARSRAPGALLWAFEPNRENHRCAQMTVALNDLGNVALLNAGLSERAGVAVLATRDAKGVPLGGGSRIVAGAELEREQAQEEIQLLAIDEVVGDGRSVAAIQLDVERHEQEALAGAIRTIRRCRPLLVVESMPDPDWVAANLDPLGYELQGRVNANFVFAVGERPRL